VSAETEMVQGGATQCE